MYSIIVGFPKLQDAINIKNLLIRNGYDVSEPCTTGAQVISLANELDEGIVLCGYRFSDMHYSELNSYLPKGFEMLLILSPERLAYCQNNDIICLPMPVKTHDLMNTLQMMTYQYRMRKKKEKGRHKERTEEEKAIIQKAKLVLMHRNNMTEEEAHRYLQKSSMNSGTNMTETAEMVLRIYD
ncbi:ANTAR domain-containing protein [Lachnospiraceae bacterium MD1]|jgi:response regulator NasT|uniref:ANTAR domain-containing protein n=1 Tax=Variimorphobacter saccharofermentans TaxID=2755051 RepID=A0A839K2H9_9FIRM|nr:ANTAR domain-containing protein [Variimorphobacter saccharofermentans]MBB2183820.1 ANTAR domain-containing protein [Variimorphobacter saccharofermentans]